jgi:hypothetical protein
MSWGRRLFPNLVSREVFVDFLSFISFYLGSFQFIEATAVDNGSLPLCFAQTAT